MAKKAKTKKDLDTPEQIIISQDKYDKLFSVELVEKAKSELINWMKHWLMVLSIIIAIIGTIGLNVIVATVIRGFIKDEIEDVRIMSGIVEKSLQESQNSMEKATLAADKYSLKVKALEEGAEKVGNRYKELENSLDTLNSSRIGISKDLTSKIQMVRKDSAEYTKALQGQIAFLKERIEKLETSQSLVQSKVSKEEDQKLEVDVNTKVSGFEENSMYTIELSYFGGFNSLAPGVARSLGEAGFQTLLSPNAPRDVDNNVGVPAGTLWDSKEIVLVYNEGEDREVVAKKILAIVKSVTGVGNPVLYMVKRDIMVQEVNPHWMVLFFPVVGAVPTIVH